MLLMRNHQDMTAVYFASMFVGMIPFMMDPNTTVCEYLCLDGLVLGIYVVVTNALIESWWLSG